MTQAGSAPAEGFREDERKFLCAPGAVPAAHLVSPRLFAQGYLSTGDPEVRVRLDRPLVTDDPMGPEFSVTVKKGGGQHRGEVNLLRIEEAEATELLRFAQPYVLRKARWKDDLWEIDLYDEPRLPGLIVLEYERKTPDMPPLPPSFPSWVTVLAEITEDKDLKNKGLARALADEALLEKLLAKLQAMHALPPLRLPH